MGWFARAAGPMLYRYFIPLLIALASLPMHCSTTSSWPASVLDLERRLYEDASAGASACVLLLNAKGGAGCSAPSKRASPLLRTDDVSRHLGDDSFAVEEKRRAGLGDDERVTLIVRASQVGSLFVATSAAESVHEKVTGVLVEAPNEGDRPVEGFSPVKVSKWNRAGSEVDITLLRLGIPVFQLNAETTSRALEHAAARPPHTASLDTRMSAAAIDGAYSWSEDTFSCLHHRNCQPLGGYSVVADAIDATYAAESDGEQLLLTASVDSLGLFHDSVQGTDSPLTGLVVLLAAAEMVANAAEGTTLEPRRSVSFAAFAGEPWGFLGSRRFLYEVGRAKALRGAEDAGEGVGGSVRGMSFESVDLESTTVVEIGPVGGVKREYTSAASTVPEARTYPVSADPTIRSQHKDLLNRIAAELNTSVFWASGNETIAPDAFPASSAAAMRADHGIGAAALIGDYGNDYENAFFASAYDDASNYDVRRVKAAAIGVARFALAFAFDVDEAAAEALIPDGASDAIVDELASCLLEKRDRMDCDLAKSLLGEPFSLQKRSFYVSVFRFDPERTSQSYAGKNAVNVFVHRFLQDRLGGAGSIPSKDNIGAGGNGTAIVRFVPALSPHIFLDETGDVHWAVNLTSFESSGRNDELWSESDWPGDTLRVYFYSNDRRHASERFVPLILGLLVTIATWTVGVGTSRWMKTKLIKVT